MTISLNVVVMLANQLWVFKDTPLLVAFFPMQPVGSGRGGDSACVTMRPVAVRSQGADSWPSD
jgi:hypothetical protein